MRDTTSDNADVAPTDWVTLAERRPESVLHEVFWVGVDVAVIEHGDVDDHVELAEVAGTLIRHLDDPAAVRAPVNTLDGLLRRDEPQALGAGVVRDAVVDAVRTVVEAPHVAPEVLEELGRLVPAIAEAGAQSPSEFCRTDAAAVFLVLVDRGSPTMERLAVGLLHATFSPDTIQRARDSIPAAVTPPKALHAGGDS